MVKTLLELRKEKKVQRREVCRRLGISEMNMYHYEIMLSSPNVIDALLLANYYGKKVKEIKWSK